MKKAFFSLMLINLFLILQIGCINERPLTYPIVYPSDQDILRTNEAIIGRTQSQIEYRWGPPNSKITSHLLTKDGKKLEEWIYKEMGLFRMRIIFIDGKATEIKYGLPF